jgi:D-sedoheptulose 7-phosphate isomerase
MAQVPNSFAAHVWCYADRLSSMLHSKEMSKVEFLARAFAEAWREGRHVYLCGNGGSAGNANHLANDFTYGVGVKHGIGMRVESLSANSSVITCLGNDIGYERIYSEQVRVKGRSGDVLVVLSGSGNSPNVVEALKMGNSLGMKTFALLGFNGGKCKELAQVPIHFEIDDMQVAEDLQLVVGHLIMQWLCDQGPTYSQ